MSSSLKPLIEQLMEAIAVHGNRTQVLSLYQELLKAYEERRALVEEWRSVRDVRGAADIASGGKAKADATYDQELTAAGGNLVAYKQAAREMETIEIYLRSAALFSAPAHL